MLATAAVFAATLLDDISIVALSTSTSISLALAIIPSPPPTSNVIVSFED